MSANFNPGARPSHNERIQLTLKGAQGISTTGIVPGIQKATAVVIVVGKGC
jgi:hypothetical protein